MLRGEEGVSENVKERLVLLNLFHTEFAYQLVIMADGDTQDLGDSFCDYYGRNCGGYRLW